jgi:hypothetical protein
MLTMMVCPTFTSSVGEWKLLLKNYYAGTSGMPIFALAAMHGDAK